MYQLCFYVPERHLEKVKNALFAAGAGQYAGYDCCAWQTLGQGQFRPLEKSRPYIGDIDKLERILEYKVEMVCVENRIKQAIAALLETHPYELPAYSVYKIMTYDDL